MLEDAGVGISAVSLASGQPDLQALRYRNHSTTECFRNVFRRYKCGLSLATGRCASLGFESRQKIPMTALIGHPWPLPTTYDRNEYNYGNVAADAKALVTELVIAFQSVRFSLIL